jgi:hypothetical protein
VLADTAPAGTGEALLRVAVARSPRDLRGHAALVAAALARGDAATAVAHVDTMLRVEPDLLPRLFPTVLALASAPEGRAPLGQALARQPPWRDAALRRLILDAPQVAAVAPLVESVARGTPGLPPRELGAWLDRLVREGLWAPAYITWVAQLPPERATTIGSVFDGGFESDPTHLGFDWRFGRVPGARISRERGDGAQGHALHVEFDDRRVPFRHVRQLLALGPGHWRLEGRVRLDSLRAARGLEWRVDCASGGKLGATAPMAGNHPWRAFTLDFDVPKGCGAQWLQLHLPARIAAERRIGGDAWFDDLVVRERPLATTGAPAHAAFAPTSSE